jgi:hypothetical protein
METEGSLLCSQEPTTGPYPEPENPVSILPPHFPNIESDFILPSTPRSSE